MSPVPQSAPNIDWLDEELRREKGLTAELSDTVDKQQVALVDQAQRIMALETRLSKLQAQLVRIPEVEEALQRTREEVVLMLAELRQEQQKRETEFLRNRQAEREQVVRAVQEIQSELARLGAVEQSVAVLRAEEQRINETVLRMRQELESLGRHLPRAEEARRGLADAIDKNAVAVGQTEAALEESRQVQNDHLSRLLLLEDASVRTDQQMAELQEMRRQLTDQQTELLENQRRAERARAQAMAEWGRRLEGYAHQLEGWSDQLRYFTDHHEKNRRVLREVQELAQEISQQQDRLRQLQRVAEEQLRRELREWRSENDRRWTQEVERHERYAGGQAERDEAQDQALDHLAQLQADLAGRLGSLEDRTSSSRLGLLADLANVKGIQQRLLQKLIDTVGESVAELDGSLREEEE
jgi:chromosome segregation ATPase